MQECKIFFPAFVVAVLMSSAVLCNYWPPVTQAVSNEENRNGDYNDDTHTLLQDVHTNIPFFYIPPLNSNDSDPPFLDLMNTLDRYKSGIDDAISSMVRSAEIAQKSEWMIWPDDDDDPGNYDSDDPGPHAKNNDANNLGTGHTKLSGLLEKRIASTAEALESDMFVLEKLLQPFPIVKSLPMSSNYCKNDDEMTEWQRLRNEGRQYKTSSSFVEKENSSYDSAMQVITHIVRDWSDLGIGIRQSLYKWCIEQLDPERQKPQKKKMEIFGSIMKNKPSPDKKKVLVPGAGLGRLAFDIAAEGFNVEANEISIVMSAAAHQFLHNRASGHVYPFAFDFLTNEVDSSNRYQSVSFPSSSDEFVHRQRKKNGGHLSYSVGNFVEIYSTKQQRESFDAIVTCFFIDTATNIYEYLLVIKNILKRDGGVWINVGPIQWHNNAKLCPSGDELRSMIEVMGFTIKAWTVDETAVNYRHDDSNESTRFTKYEGYRPLRFVAILSS